MAEAVEDTGDSIRTGDRWRVPPLRKYLSIDKMLEHNGLLKQFWTSKM